MHVLKLGRHRLNISIRLDRTSGVDLVERAYAERNLKREARSLREHWEHESFAKIGWVR